MDQRITFTPDEVARLADTEFFRAKNQISAKVRQSLEQLHRAFQLELVGRNLLKPNGFNPESAQFVKGENLEDFPYQYLDFPRHYTREEKFSFRSLFWWGHHVVFALILEGSYIRQYKQNVINRYPMLVDQGICLCLSPSLWEWKVGPGFTLELTQDRKSEVAAVLANRSSLKIAHFLPMTHPLVQSGEFVPVGQEKFRAMLSIITPP
ncbi:MAG: hypothetical protein JSU59_00655 [Nitrospirota bacterium]|nr:MAG: hypothetical protein JSU59_00655 [Nitrospirota bacterium]